MNDQEQFQVPSLGTRVLFGSNVHAQLGAVVDELGASRVVIVGSHGRSSTIGRLIDTLGDRHAGTDHRAVMHVPTSIVSEVLADVTAMRCDLLVAIGGGSAIGLAKAIALHGGPPFVAIPTTYSGSEMTPIWGMTSDGIKKTGRDERVRPKVVLYDPLLVGELPLRVAVPSAINALAHCVEALYAPDANPLASIAAGEGARLILHALPSLRDESARFGAHAHLLEGAWLAGLALGMVQMGLHHKLCHVLGGTFGLPHAETHAILLPYTLSYNADAAVDRLKPLRQAIGVESASETARRLHEVVSASLAAAGAPTQLAAVGFTKADAARAAELATTTPYPNPAPVERNRIERLLESAIEGDFEA